MTTFILNKELIHTTEKRGITLLDYIRYGVDLHGTKIGCREGDCGACTVLEGRLIDNKLVYRSIVSCLTPLGNAHGKHIVTVEGLNMEELSPVQQAMVDHNGSQCGFCTPGFIISLTGHTLTYQPSNAASAIDSVNGNICRCTGYKSIERAAISISKMLKDKNPENPIEWLVRKQFLPTYFTGIPKLLQTITDKHENPASISQVMGGGTDLMVQKPDEMAEQHLTMFFDKKELKGIEEKDGQIIIGAAATANDIMDSALIIKHLPAIKQHFRLVSSDPIRNMGTIGGNIVNASPIADLVIYFLALNASVKLYDENNYRILPLRSFYMDYKKLAMQDGEYIESVSFPIPEKPFAFNFEKVSKRTHLDIASVNTALFIKLQGEVIDESCLAIGGVSPIPLFMEKCGNFLKGKTLNIKTLKQAAEILDSEISPISDVRGSQAYKRLLARQLFYAHFLELFPSKFSLQELTS